MTSALFVWLAAACGGSDDPSITGAQACDPGTQMACRCPDQRPSMAACMPNGTLGPCACAVAATAGTAPTTAGVAAIAGTTPPAAGTISFPMPTGMTGSVAGISASVGGRTGGLAGRTGGAAGTGFGRAGTGAAGVGAAGIGAPTAGTTATAGTSGTAGTGAMSSEEVEMARQVCVDEINRYRAMVMVPALMRGTAAQEMCSDMGAKQDGDSGVAHGSASLCSKQGLPGQQDTCPGWGVGGRSGNATLADALKKCLAAMWAEGVPPQGREACIAEQRSGGTCFQKYGHYLNMSDPAPKVVACGFYKMTNGSWWMNQNFGR